MVKCTAVALLMLVSQCAHLCWALNIARYSESPTQYHIQADLGGDRFFRYQTYNGQWRKEKRLRNGKVIGAYGWTDDKGILRLYDYLADEQGYRVVRERSMKVAEEGKDGQHPINTNRILKRKRPASYNSIRKRNLEKARKLSHDLKKIGLNEAKTSSLSSEGGAKTLQHQTILSDSSTRLSSAVTDTEGQTTIDFDTGHQFHFEVTRKDGSRVGRHGYVDPLGFLRVTNYVSSAMGHNEDRTSRFVGTRRVGEDF